MSAGIGKAGNLRGRVQPAAGGPRARSANPPLPGTHAGELALACSQVARLRLPDLWVIAVERIKTLTAWSWANAGCAVTFRRTVLQASAVTTVLPAILASKNSSCAAPTSLVLIWTKTANER